MVWKKCSKCSYVWMSSIEEKCPISGRFNQRILDIEKEVRKSEREKVKKPSPIGDTVSTLPLFVGLSFFQNPLSQFLQIIICRSFCYVKFGRHNDK